MGLLESKLCPFAGLLAESCFQSHLQVHSSLVKGESPWSKSSATCLSGDREVGVGPEEVLGPPALQGPGGMAWQDARGCGAGASSPPT